MIIAVVPGFKVPRQPLPKPKRSSRIALWGTSLSGGHAVIAAAKDGNIACVSAQVPLLDGEAGGVVLLKRNGLGYSWRMTFGHALRDLVRSWLGMSSHRSP